MVRDSRSPSLSKKQREKKGEAIPEAGRANESMQVAFSDKASSFL